MIYICDEFFAPLYEIEEYSDCLVYESLDAQLVIQINGIPNIDIQDSYTLKYNDNYFDIINAECGYADGYFQYKLDCEHISYRLNFMPFEGFSQNAPPTAILQELLYNTILQVGTIEFADSINFSSTTKTARGLLMELSFQLHGYITYSGFSINILQNRGDTTGKNFDEYEFSEIKKVTDKRNNTATYTANVRYLKDIAIGDSIIFEIPELGISDNLRVISIETSPEQICDFALEIADWKFGELNREQSLTNDFYKVEEYVSSGGGGGEGGGGTTIANAVIIGNFAATTHMAEVQIDREIEYYVGNFATVPDKALTQYNFGVSPPVFYAQDNGLTFQSGDSYELFGLTYILQEYNQIEMENGDKIDLKMEFVSLTTSSTTFMITSTRNGDVVGTYSRGIASSPEDPIVNFGMSLGQSIGGGYSISGINSALVGASGVPVISLGSVVGSTSVTYPILPITIYTISQSGTVAKSAPRCGQWISPAANTNIKMSSDEYINALQIQSITVTSGWQTMATFS